MTQHTAARHKRGGVYFEDFVPGDVVEHRLAAGVEPVGPAALRGPCVDHALAGACDDDVVGREEARFLVDEQLVEGPARDAGEGDHVGDRGRLVAALGDRLDHRTVEARPLVAGDLLTVHTARPVWQPAV